MFREFREDVKKILKERKISYMKLGDMTGFAWESVAQFMAENGRDSRRIAEAICDALGMAMIYRKGTYHLKK